MVVRRENHRADEEAFLLDVALPLLADQGLYRPRYSLRDTFHHDGNGPVIADSDYKLGKEQLVVEKSGNDQQAASKNQEALPYVLTHNREAPAEFRTAYETGTIHQFHQRYEQEYKANCEPRAKASAGQKPRNGALPMRKTRQRQRQRQKQKLAEYTNLPMSPDRSRRA